MQEVESREERGEGSAWTLCSGLPKVGEVESREKRGEGSAWLARLGAPRMADAMLYGCPLHCGRVLDGNENRESTAWRMPCSTDAHCIVTKHYLLPSPPYSLLTPCEARSSAPATHYFLPSPPSSLLILPSPYLISLRSSSRGSVSMVSVSERMLSASPRFRWCSALTLSSIVLIACRW